MPATFSGRRSYESTKPGFSFWTTVRKTVRPVLSDGCHVYLSVCPVLSVTLVYCGQTVGWIKIKLGMLVGLDPGHTVLDGDPALSKGAQPPISCPCLLWPNGRRMKMSLVTEVDLGPGHIVLDGDPAPPSPRKGQSRPLFLAHVCFGHGRPSQLLLSSCFLHRGSNHILPFVVFYHLFVKFHCNRFNFRCLICRFWATVCKTVRPMVPDRCPVCPVC